MELEGLCIMDSKVIDNYFSFLEEFPEILLDAWPTFHLPTEVETDAE